MCYYKLIKTKRLAGWLMYKGFTLIRMNKDKKNPKYDIYVFENKDGIEGAIDSYVKENRR